MKWISAHDHQPAQKILTGLHLELHSVPVHFTVSPTHGNVAGLPSEQSNFLLNMTAEI